jgi:hypothetical protein
MAIMSRSTGTRSTKGIASTGLGSVITEAGMTMIVPRAGRNYLMTVRKVSFQELSEGKSGPDKAHLLGPRLPFTHQCMPDQHHDDCASQDSENGMDIGNGHTIAPRDDIHGLGPRQGGDSTVDGEQYCYATERQRELSFS